MHGQERSDLALFADSEGNAVRITVLGPAPSAAGVLAAEIVVDTTFVAGRLDLPLWKSRLESWRKMLDRLETGEDGSWLHVERGPTVSIRLTGERDCPEVVIEDDLLSMVIVRVPVDLPDDWIATHRRLLTKLLDVWGSELSSE